MVDLAQPSFNLMLLGLCVWIALRMLYGARGPAQGDAVHHALAVLSWGLLIVPAMVLLFAATSYLSLLMALIVAETLVEFVIEKRSAERRSAWRLFASALHGKQPLGEALAWRQTQFSGKVGRVFRKLVADLRRGVPWQQAMSKHRRAFPREAPALAGFLDFRSEDEPQRDVGPDAWAESDDGALAELWRQSIQRTMYMTTTLLATVGVLLFITMWVLPDLRSIFEDFGLELPVITASVFDWSPAIGVVLFFAGLILAAGLVGFLLLVVAPYFFDIHLLRGFSDRLFITQHRAHIYRMLSVATERQLAIDATLNQLADGWSRYPSSWIRQRAADASRDVQNGAPWQRALENHGLATQQDGAVMAAAQHSGNLPWALQMLARRKVQLLAFRWSLLQQAVFSAAILAMGALVLWIAVATIVPLAELISNIA